MAEPAKKLPEGDDGFGSFREQEAPVEDCCWLHRPVFGSDGSVQFLERPLTPEDFLNPRYGDQFVQGPVHGAVTRRLADGLERHLRRQEEMLVLSDTKLLWGIRKLRHKQPAPDVMVVRGARDKTLRGRASFHVGEQGVLPCLVVEVVSERDARIRRVDLEEKYELYQAVGIPEYLQVAPPKDNAPAPFRLTLYRLDALGRYQRVEPDGQGRLLSKTTGVLFAVSPEGDRLLLFDAATGERLLTSEEEEDAHHQAETARREAEARAEAAEAEVARLREELRRHERPLPR